MCDFWPVFSPVSTPAQPVVNTDALVATADTITLSWTVPPDVTGSEVSWELTEQTRRRRQVRNAEGGTSGRLPADQNSYTIDKLRNGTIAMTSLSQSSTLLGALPPPSLTLLREEVSFITNFAIIATSGENYGSAVMALVVTLQPLSVE